MTKYRYDLHLHSCLSPCADDDMTPANIAGMALLNGLQLAALSDHNSCKNCPAFFDACRVHGIVPVAGYMGPADEAAVLLMTGRLPIIDGLGSCGGGCGGGCGGCGGEDDGSCGCGCGCH